MNNTTLGTNGGIIKDDGILVCFVNSETPPTKCEFLGYLVTRIYGSDVSPEYSISIVEKAFYPHPSCPEDATVVAIRNRVVKKVKHGEDGYAQAVCLYYAQESMKSVASIE